MDTNTILIVINLVVAAIITPAIQILMWFVQNMKVSRCCGSETVMRSPVTLKNPEFDLKIEKTVEK